MKTFFRRATILCCCGPFIVLVALVGYPADWLDKLSNWADDLAWRVRERFPDW